MGLMYVSAITFFILGIICKIATYVMKRKLYEIYPDKDNKWKNSIG